MRCPHEAKDEVIMSRLYSLSHFSGELTIDAVADLGSDLKSHSPSESVWYVFNKVSDDQLEGRNMGLHGGIGKARINRIPSMVAI